MADMKIEVPRLQRDAFADKQCHRAHADHMETINLPPELVDNWQQRALEKMEQLLGRYRSLRDYLDICVRCGSCADKCPFFLGTGDPKNMPVARAELLRKVYRYYFTAAGWLPDLGRAEPLTEEVLNEWYTYFYQCSECRRCSVFCPYGIDTAEITMAAREIMASIGVANKYITEVLANVYRTGNNIGIPAPAWADNLEFLEDDIQEDTGVDVKMPVDQEGADVLLVPPSADNFVNLDTMMGYGKVFHAAGISWTTATYASEAANFGLFLDFNNMKKVNKRIIDAARRLKVKRIVFGECGHAWRVALYMNTLNGPLDFLEVPNPIHCTEFTLDLLKRGAFKLDKSANDEYVVTYHDPCNIARAGGPLEPPRELIRASCNRFEEMPENTTRINTFCCGGGGGLLSDEHMDVRMAGAKMRAMAVQTTNANYLATMCAICKAQLKKVNTHYKLGVEVEGVHGLFGRALVLNGNQEV
ncbi:MAG: (Fe-S)-binding protein [Chloroflexi bacterium]|nr:(Fe-S)-binding protein [Chloroflexota bacterium]